jgi:hypothetical protein
MRLWRAMAGLGLAMLAREARAAGPAWTACRIENGVLVVPAQAAGLTGPFILDTATARSVLDATQASLAGIEPGQALAPVRVGGRRLAKVEMTVAALDARTRALPTPITGVLGADVLEALVLEVRTRPCRFRLAARPAPPPGRPLAILPVEIRNGVPYARAAVSDGRSAMAGLFRIATGADLAVRLGPDVARVEGAPAGARDPTAPLRALSLGEALIENPRAAIAAEAAPGVAGEIGEPALAGYDLTLDLRRRRLTLSAPETKRTRRHSAGGS